MKSYNTLLCLVIPVIGIMFMSGCGSAQKQMPHMFFGGFNVETQLGREDIVLVDTVEGSSTLTTILGFINIVDGDKLELFGIKFFKDKYTYFKSYDSRLGQVADRAYYKALEATPDADVIFEKSVDHEDGGFPLIYATKVVTFRGKAMKLKVDQ
ncbi:MAG: hypothetical protein JXA96_09255 [Sedimentisphaerales bacterium]|nr:hypothetical protein [Sedimentisphaerales bacterium]